MSGGALYMYHTYNKDSSTDNRIFSTPVAENKDNEYRLAIADAYCRIGLKTGKLPIDKFEECLKAISVDPLRVYRELTNKNLPNWDSLSFAEKSLVVEEVQNGSRARISSYEDRKLMEAMRAQFKK